ncbi:NAD-dependent epimerase/dehydratase family protein [Mesorhizobium sp. 1B3]|uniref:NAD-dependent epimerase/dehydratase family protein n=1 Tax=Mesorhizobium sp. 1B3 TaxID=3243599 RepID=UPI003D96D5D1
MTVRSQKALGSDQMWKRPVAVIGGCGFIGCNLADSLLSDGIAVLVADNLSRPGVEQNRDWLTARHGQLVEFRRTDVRNTEAIGAILADVDAVFHLAAQTAVTTSLVRPVEDFEINARGTLNVLEAARATGRQVPVIFASTNKVYGALDDVAMIECDDRFIPERSDLRTHGIDESRGLDFCTPYGCSKGVADQYVLDYARSFGVPAAVLRMSCIYGPHQFGTEDQGWVAHFLLRALVGDPITIYGNGKQVRDILHVSDAIGAYRHALGAIHEISGQAFNLGGGVNNAVSLKLLLSEICRFVGHEVSVTYADWRTGDQPYFVADTRKLQTALGWRSRVSWRDGVRQLARWLAEHRLQDPASQDRRITA